MNKLKLLALLLFTKIAIAEERPITIAILAKDKAPCLPIYLGCLEKQTWPKSKTRLYIRTNNNSDESAEVLESWIEKVKDQYLEIYFDKSDVDYGDRKYKNHEWDWQRFKILGKIRQDSINYALENETDYFVADCDNFILSDTVEILANANLPIVAPLLHTNCAYSNFHAAVDQNGYLQQSQFYLPMVNMELKGLIQVPVVHCTYFIKHEYLKDMSYDDESYRFEYVIFSDNARKKNIPQYLDCRKGHGRITFASTIEDLKKEPWIGEYQEFMPE